jgi:copper(I)-binding protein
MLVDLKQPLKQGERFKGTLVFEKAGRIPVEFEVRALGAGAGHGAHHAH